MHNRDDFDIIKAGSPSCSCGEDLGSHNPTPECLDIMVKDIEEASELFESSNK